MKAPSIVTAADGIHLVAGNNTNWILVEDGGALTLVDSGYPGDRDAVEASVRELGHRPEDIAAILVTHAHVDHIGSVSHFVRRYGLPVYMSEQEVRHARREYLEQATPLLVAANAWRPRVLPWSLHAVCAGATRNVSVPTAQAFPRPGALDLPGGPIPVPTPGHTSGHCAYYFPEVGAVVTGDTLVTGHATSAIEGPQFLLSMFNHDGPQTNRALDALVELDADVLLPGHGPLGRGPVREAVATARATAGRSRP